MVFVLNTLFCCFWDEQIFPVPVLVPMQNTKRHLMQLQLKSDNKRSYEQKLACNIKNEQEFLCICQE